MNKPADGLPRGLPGRNFYVQHLHFQEGEIEYPKREDIFVLVITEQGRGCLVDLPFYVPLIYN